MLDHFRYLWDWTLSVMRGMTPGTPHLSWSDVRAWSETFGISLAPWEAEAIVAMGDAYFTAVLPSEARG